VSARVFVVAVGALAILLGAVASVAERRLVADAVVERLRADTAPMDAWLKDTTGAVPPPSPVIHLDAAPVDSSVLLATAPVASLSFSRVEPSVWCMTFRGLPVGSVGGAPDVCRRCRKPLVPSGTYSSEVRLDVRGVTRFDGCVYCLADAVDPAGSR
jgi:hypothetical protein